MVGQLGALEEIRNIRAQLERPDPPPNGLIERYHDVISRASQDGPAETAPEAVACLKIALHAMGASRESLRPEEMLIKHAITYLKNSL